MSLPTNFKDKYNSPYSKTEVAQVKYWYDWGYGIILQDIFDSVTSASYHASETDANNNITPTAVTVVTTPPVAGQIRMNYLIQHQVKFVSANGADDGKWLRIVGTAIGSGISSKEMNAITAQINQNTDDILALQSGTSGSVEFKIKSVVPAYNSDLIQSANIIVNMTKDVDPATLSNVTLKDSIGAVACTVSLNASDAKQIIINPNTDLTVANNPQKVVVLPGLKATDGEVLGYSVEWSFNTTVNSAPTVTVSVAGATTVGSTLTASTTVSDPEDDTVSSTTWEWLRNDVVITGAITNTYTLVEADVGTIIKAKATVTMATGTNPSPATSSGTSIPIPVPTDVTATEGNNQVTINWINNASLSGETYTVKRSTTQGSGYVALSGASGLTGNSYVDSTAVNGTTYYYVVTLTVNGVESGNSTEVTATPMVTTKTLSSTDTGLLIADGFDSTFDTIKWEEVDSSSKLTYSITGGTLRLSATGYTGDPCIRSKSGLLSSGSVTVVLKVTNVQDAGMASINNCIGVGPSYSATQERLQIVQDKRWASGAGLMNLMDCNGSTNADWGTAVDQPYIGQGVTKNIKWSVDAIQTAGSAAKYKSWDSTEPSVWDTAGTSVYAHSTLANNRLVMSCASISGTQITDYHEIYAYKGNIVKVNGIVSGKYIELVDDGNNVIASGTASSTTIDLNCEHVTFTVNGKTIKVNCYTDSSKANLEWTTGVVANIYGGAVLNVA